MIGIILMTHGDLGRELIRTSELITGKQERLISFGLHQNDDVQELYKKLRDGIQTLDDGSGVLVLTDLFGGSPSNITAANIKIHNFESVTGVNLGMLIEALCSRESYTLQELSDVCMHSGVVGIKNLRKTAEERMKLESEA